MEKTKPYLTLILIQSIYTGMFLLSKTVFDGGMSTFIFVFYRQATATLFLRFKENLKKRKTEKQARSPPSGPYALVHMSNPYDKCIQSRWRAMREKITTSLLGCILQDFWAISIWIRTRTNCSTKLSFQKFGKQIESMHANSNKSIHKERMEAVKLRTSPGVAKITGIAVCIGGAATIAFYQGPQLRLLVHHHLFSTPTRHNVAHGSSFSGTWVKGVFLMLLSNCLWGLWIVLQKDVNESSLDLLSTTNSYKSIYMKTITTSKLQLKIYTLTLKIL
ncbi:hypothetical protein OSB04_un001018 [Centaurea solstitialis]|uniref:WAT1-related protein n=1 Tax=Centaurea solstitialis TaxID=347529 RepID=A0AA38SMI2_9ASTR|nr:hypothetical protein OSB04_un001018 [Centaurea solstitialis]